MVAPDLNAEKEVPGPAQFPQGVAVWLAGLALLVMVAASAAVALPSAFRPHAPHHVLLWELGAFTVLFALAQFQGVITSRLSYQNTSVAVMMTVLLLEGAAPTMVVIIVGQFLASLWTAYRMMRREGIGVVIPRLPLQLFDYVVNASIKCVAVAGAACVLLLDNRMPWDGTDSEWPNLLTVIPVAVVLVLLYMMQDEIAIALLLGKRDARQIVRHVLKVIQPTMSWQLGMAYMGVLAAALYLTSIEWMIGLFGFAFVLERAYIQHTNLQREHEQASGTLRRAVQGLGHTLVPLAPESRATTATDSAPPPAPTLVAYSEMIVEQLDRGRELLRYKDEFMSIVSHELRTPLTVLMGGLDLLAMKRERENANDPLLKDIIRLKAQCTQIKDILEVVLDVARREADVFAVAPVETDAAAIVRQTVESMQAVVQTHHLEVDAPPTLLLLADPPRLVQVLTNLIQNACKYSPRGSTVTVTLVTADGDALFAVRDTGIGIPPDEQDRVFARFERASNVGRATGLGAGLYVSRAIVERHGGRIWFESTIGQGSTFYVALPLAT